MHKVQLYKNKFSETIVRLVKTIAIIFLGIVVNLTVFSALRVSATPTINEYPTSAHPREITTGPDGNLWFTNASTDSIYRITTSGVITKFSLSSIPGPLSITAGPDGAMWFTITPPNGATAGAIGRITTSGVITEYPLSGTLAPAYITTGSDGALWFTENIGNGSGQCGGGEIGRITTSGVITQYPYPTACPELAGIAAGPDGALWVAESAANSNSTGAAIAQVTTSGVITRYPIPTSYGPNPSPYSITAGPDGAMWFTEPNNDRIGTITTSGAITLFPYQTQSVQDITTGPDGALWFTDYNGNEIGRVNTSGVVTAEYPIPSGGSGNPIGITTGPDGALWFTEYTADKIGQLIPTITPIQAINAGGSGSGAYSADEDYSGGTTYTTSSSVDTSGVTNPAPQSVYQSARYGSNFNYTFSNLEPNTAYTLRLDFNELYWGTSAAGSSGSNGGVGSRVFDVAANGQSVLTNFDIYATAGGANKAVSELVPVTTDNSGNVVVNFASVVDNAMVSGLSIYSGTTPAITPPTPITNEQISAGGSGTGSFVADEDYVNGAPYSTSSSVDTSGPTTNPAPEAVYQSARYGYNFTYNLSNLTPNTNYNVQLDFNELYWGTANAGYAGGIGSRVLT
jgi:virginiamycin B lyase